jgi:acyl-coenzyme A synthetase/AMP-(fatty) acid ligase
MTAAALWLVTPDEEHPIAWHAGRAVARSEFVHSAAALAARLPDTRYALNVCRNRYAFVLGFAAACLRGQINLLPWSDAPAVLERSAHDYPDHHVLDDRCLELAAPRDAQVPDTETSWPCIAVDQRVAIVFTSGTTGSPQSHPKTWAALCATGRAVADALPAGLNIVATVPAQHMYGLETTIALPCASNCAVHDGRPFFPLDVQAALASIPAPRALVTTPAHLRVFVDSQVELPALELILSATAPLAAELASRAEALWQTVVHEIYGNTEAGVIAARRTVDGEEWQVIAGVELQQVGDGVRCVAPYLADSVLLQDSIRMKDARRFVLLGRSTDLIKVAGKRISLRELTQQLLDVPGVRDCVVFQPDPEARPAALVVASGLAARDIGAALARRVDASFVPRPLVIVDALPRNAVGKIEQAALLSAIRAHRE